MSGVHQQKEHPLFHLMLYYDTIIAIMPSYTYYNMRLPCGESAHGIEGNMDNNALCHTHLGCHVGEESPCTYLLVGSIDDRCANPRNLFRPFHAPHPSKIAEIDDTQKM